ncbi:transmembrane protein [Cystoisospora suis]|uniref:Transmembrane protein n=1 Tax=Cystoisospora suis TaxID=483139 RepID=A0A2C6LFD4_9APIC|nr:transmembrane protein [Cystoisospora suis]
MTNYTLVEEAENSLLALLQPGAYRITYQAEEPFLITFGISSLDQLHRDLMYKPPVSSVAADDPGRLQAQVDFSSSSSCLSAPPALALPSPLPFYFESDIFDIKLHPSFLQKQGEIMTIPIQLTTPSVLYMETGSNFLLDFVKVGVKVAEGTWIGEQRSRVNFLRLILEPGTHYIKILNAHSKNTYHMEHEIKSEIDRERCLHFSLKIKSIAVNYAGERSDGSDGEGESSCFSYGAMSLPLDFHSSEGGSSALGGPIDANGRLLIRSKIVLTEGSAGGGGRKRVALDTRGRKLVVKLGVFSEDHERNVVVQVEDSHSLPVTPLYDWVTSDGSSEVLYELDGQTRKYNALDESSMFFLTFRIDKQGVPGMSSCVVFDLFLQVMPLEDKLNQMSMCPVGGGSVPVLTSEEFFPKTAVQVATERSSSHSTGLQQYISTQLTAIQEKKDGFLAEIPFTLTEESFILTDVQYNFFLSHVEVDLILDESKTRGQSVAVQRSSYHNGDGESISFGELDFINRGNHPLNARQWIATQLEPGHYILRIADDHYAKHFSSLSSSSCFPFKFSFQSFSLASRQTKPSIVGIHPDPSVPVKYGQDLLILIRLSTPPSVLGGETARRSAYLFGESGFTLYSTHFANLDSPDDEDARYLNEEEEEERKNGGETGHGGRRGGLVWSFLFTADKLQRLGNKAKFVLEFTTRQGGESYVLGVLPSGVYTPQAPQSVVTGIASDTSGATSNRDLGITYTFLSPGSLRENTPWSGTPGLISFASTSTSSSPGSISSSSSQGGSAGGGGGDHMYDTRVERGPVSHEGDVQTTQGESAGIVKPETGMSDGRGREETRSEIVNELNRATSYGNEERRGEISPRPLIPPKAPRETLLVEEDEEDFSHEDRDGSDAYHPHSKHHHPTDERDRIHRGVYTPGTARGGEMMREHPEEEEEMSSALSVSHDPYNREDEDFHKEKIRRKLMRNAYDGGSHEEEEEEEGDLGCPPGMRWREDLNECEEADDLR